LLKPQNVVETALIENYSPKILLADSACRLNEQVEKFLITGEHKVDSKRIFVLGEGYYCKYDEVPKSFGLQIVQFIVRFQTALLLTDHLLLDYFGEVNVTALLKRMVRTDQKIGFWLNKEMYKKFQKLFSVNGFQEEGFKKNIKIYKKTSESPISDKNIQDLLSDLFYGTTNCGI